MASAANLGDSVGRNGSAPTGTLEPRGVECAAAALPSGAPSQGPRGPTPKNSDARLGGWTEVPEWLNHVPIHIRKHLFWEDSHTFEIPDKAILLLYAGKRDVWKEDKWWRSIDEKIEQLDTVISKRLIPIDIERNKRTHNMLDREPYN